MNVRTALRTVAAAGLVAAGLGVGTTHAQQPAPDAPTTVVTEGQTRIATDKMTYLVGEPITISYTLPARGYIRITDYQGSKVSTLRSGYRQRTEDTIRGTVSPPVGKECLLLEYSPRPLPPTPPDRAVVAALKKAPGGQGPAYAETCFDVLEKKAEPTPTPAPTSAPPVISGLSAQAAGTFATVTFTTAEPAYVTINHKPVTAPAATQATAQVFDGQFQATTSPTATNRTPAQVFDGQFQATRTYATTHELKLSGLQSNTTYDVTVTAESQAGQKSTAQTRFTTAKKRVFVVLESIDIEEDGDWVGDGEPVWFVKPYWDGGSFKGSNDGAYCYPNEGSAARCKYGEFGEGRITPRNSRGNAMMFVFAEEHFDRFPSRISLQAWAKEDDLVGGSAFIECIIDTINSDNDSCSGDGSMAVEWTVPQGVESAEQRVTVPGNHPGRGFKSVLTFRFELTHHNAPYNPVPNHPAETWYG
jgi:hypothetical protein